MKRRWVTDSILLILLLSVSLYGCGDEEEELVKEPVKELKIEVIRSVDEVEAQPSVSIEEDEDENSDSGAEKLQEWSGETDGQGDEESGQENEQEDTVQPSSASGEIAFDGSWKYADMSAINSGTCIMYRASGNRKDVVIGVNAGHGTKGGTGAKTYSHPDMTPKATGGTNPKGAVKSTAISGGMTFLDGTKESAVTLREAQILRDRLVAAGYDVLMVRDGEDVQLDNVARTVMCNNNADCHIALHWDGDGLDYDKGCFYCSVPDAIKQMEPVASTWQESERLGDALIGGLSAAGCKINGNGSMDIDLTQTSFSTIPSVDIELGNAASAHDDATLGKLADGLVKGIDSFFGAR